MNIAISNIAWDQEKDKEVLGLLRELGINGLEIAPSKIVNSFSDLDTTKKYLLALQAQALEVVSLQSLLYGHPELQIFTSKSARQNTLNFLKDCVVLASCLQAKTLVFGSPKNRIIGKLKHEIAHEIASEFFQTLGNFAVQNGVAIAIEANPKEYGGDFICTTKEALDFVVELNNPGIGLNLDLGTMTLNHEDYQETLRAACAHAIHFHISEPFLAAIPQANTPHQEIAKILKALKWNNWVSIEMIAAEPTKQLENIKSALSFVQATYT